MLEMSLDIGKLFVGLFLVFLNVFECCENAYSEDHLNEELYFIVFSYLAQTLSTLGAMDSVQFSTVTSTLASSQTSLHRPCCPTSETFTRMSLTKVQALLKLTPTRSRNFIYLLLVGLKCSQTLCSVRLWN